MGLMPMQKGPHSLNLFRLVTIHQGDQVSYETGSRTSLDAKFAATLEVHWISKMMSGLSAIYKRKSSQKKKIQVTVISK